MPGTAVQMSHSTYTTTALFRYLFLSQWKTFPKPVTARGCLPCWDLVSHQSLPTKLTDLFHPPEAGMQVVHQEGLQESQHACWSPVGDSWWLQCALTMLHSCVLQVSPSTPVVAIGTDAHEFLDETRAFVTWETALCWSWNGQGVFWSLFCQEELCHC